MNLLIENLNYVFSTIGALLPIVNPLSTAGLVVSITANLTEAERIGQIRRACIYMFFILTTFLIAGGLIMKFFGISIPGLRIAGGMIVSYMGFRMLFPESATISSQEHFEAQQKADISFTPLAMPGLSGPGSIAVVIGISTAAQDDKNIFLDYALMIIGIAITAIICYLVLRAANRLNKILGATGMNAIARIMGFLLICMGIQFVINGALDVIHSIRR
jgi:multiple antibiotic resistance protein